MSWCRRKRALTRLRLLYLLFVAILLIGYVESLLFADSLAKKETYDAEYDDYYDVDVMAPTASISPAGKGENLDDPGDELE